MIERDNKIPRFLFGAFEFLEKNALTMEGLFRINGNLTTIENFVKYLDQGIQIKFGELEIIETTFHNISGLIKYYFRLLPEPLITWEAFGEIIKAAEIEQIEPKIEQIKKGLKLLPKQNLILLRRILELFRKIEKEKEVNKMTFSNCSTVIAPTLMSSKSDDPLLMVKITKSINSTFEYLLSSFDSIFPTGIWEASKKGEIALVKESLENFGFDVNSVDEEKKSVLHHSVGANHLDLTKFLIEKEISADLQDAQGNTALHYASQNKNEELIQLLIDYGASPFLENKNGESASKMIEQTLPELYQKLALSIRDNSSLHLLVSSPLPERRVLPQENTAPSQPQDSLSLLEELEKTAFSGLVGNDAPNVSERRQSLNSSGSKISAPSSSQPKTPSNTIKIPNNNSNPSEISPTSSNTSPSPNNNNSPLPSNKIVPPSKSLEDELLENLNKKEEPLERGFTTIKVEDLGFFVDPSIQVLWTLEPLPLVTNEELIDALIVFGAKLAQLEFGNHQSLGFGALLKNLAAGVQSFLKEVQFICESVPENSSNSLKNASIELKKTIKNIIPLVNSLRDIVTTAQNEKLLNTKSNFFFFLHFYMQIIFFFLLFFFF